MDSEQNEAGPSQSTPPEERSFSQSEPKETSPNVSLSTLSGSNHATAPPYAPPSHVLYPPEVIANPHAGDMSNQPIFENIPAGTLYRPASLPADIDTRLNKKSVWMGIEKDTNRAVYFIPPTCRCCNQPQVAQHCDRGWPVCSRCEQRGIECLPGAKWGTMKPKAKRRSLKAEAARQASFTQSQFTNPSNTILPQVPSVPSTSTPSNHTVRSTLPAPVSSWTAPPSMQMQTGASRSRSYGSSASQPTEVITSASTGIDNVSQPKLSVLDKGKAKAVDSYPPPPPPIARPQPVLTYSMELFTAPPPPEPIPARDSSPIDIEMDEEGRGKRIRKKRRLSASDEVDPEQLTSDGTLKKPRRKATATSSSLFPTGPSLAMANGPDSVTTAADKAYFARLDANNLKPPLRDMRSACPVWAHTRRSLQVATEYFRDAQKIPRGSSVQIGGQGIARGLILEDESAGQGVYWGMGAACGTIITGIAPPRMRRALDVVKLENLVTKSDEDPIKEDGGRPENGVEHSTNDESLNILGDKKLVNGDHDEVTSARIPTFNEIPEIAAILKAQRARLPIAIAVTQDYAAASFKVPRPFIVLGWFWVVDGWLEPETGQKLFPATLPTISANEAISQVRWKFRFEWCDGQQSSPWWASRYDVERPRNFVHPTAASDIAQQPWIISDHGFGGTTTLHAPSTSDQNGIHDPTEVFTCSRCGVGSSRVYQDGLLCLNELCNVFFINQSNEHHGLGPPDNRPSKVKLSQYILPEQLQLRLRAPEPKTMNPSLTREESGRDYWVGWGCGKCGMANERRRWSGWDCEACNNHIIPRERILYSESMLRDHRRPVCTGPRQDDGFPNWPKTHEVTRSSTTFTDGIKVVSHGVESFVGGGSKIYHALATQANGIHLLGEEIVRELQKQERGMVPFKRHTVACKRPAEKYLCPFYTFLCGPEPPRTFDHFPCGPSQPWRKTPQVAIDAIDIINERAGRMMPGEPERFNSLLIAVHPPQLPLAETAHIVVPAFSTFGILFLGPDGEVKIRPQGRRTKAGELTVQSGDVLVVTAGIEGIDLQLRLQTFGFIFIARQVYKETPGQRDLEGQMATSKPSTSVNPNQTASPTKISAEELGATSEAKNEPPMKPTQAPPEPLNDWYIGTRPIKQGLPIRVLPPLRQRPPPKETAPSSPKPIENQSTMDAGPSKSSANGDDNAAGVNTNENAAPVTDEPERPVETKIEVLTETPPPPTLWDQPPPSPGTKKRWCADLETISTGKNGDAKDPPPSKKARKSGAFSATADTPTSRSSPAVGTADDVSVATAGSDGTAGSKSKKRGKGPSKSKGKGKDDISIDGEEVIDISGQVKVGGKGKKRKNMTGASGNDAASVASASRETPDTVKMEVV